MNYNFFFIFMCLFGFVFGFTWAVTIGKAWLEGLVLLVVLDVLLCIVYFSAFGVE